MDVGPLGGHVFHVGLALGGRQFLQRLGQFFGLHFAEDFFVFAERVDQIAVAIAVAARGFGGRPRSQNAAAQAARVGILGDLILRVGPPIALGAVPEIGFVELGVEPDDDLVLRAVDLHDGPVLVDVERLALGQLRAVLPFAVDAFLAVAAVDRVDDDAALDGLLAGGMVVDRPLRERLVAGDEDRLVAVGLLRPIEALDGDVDHLAAVFVAAVGREGEERLGEFVEIVGERHDLADVAFGGRQAHVAVFEQRDAEHRRLALLLGLGELLDDGPQLALGLVDEAVHRIRGVEQDRHVDGRAVAAERRFC